MNKKELKIFEYTNVESAIADFQAEKIAKLIDYDSEHIILDFKGIETTTTAFFNIILEGFINKIEKANELNNILKIKNYNQIVRFAYEDAYDLLKKKLLKKNNITNDKK